ncbi:deoxyhypusine hydroxylase [Atheta coriaria]|uniref:deoxyhypusine hydroxylase n=1 Tax=Dalotia coriaria TaxID=877792 RepID=UPI0031F3FF68
MVNVTEDKVQRIGAVLCDPERPLKERFRALFTLKNIGGPVAIKCIEKAFLDSSALLKHEVAYCLGQMQDPVANKILVTVLRDKQQEAIVRHEAAEALGAIASEESTEILQEYSQDPTIEVKETCELALERLAFLQDEKNPKIEQNPYGSVDPAPPLPTAAVEDLHRTLLDPNVSLFQRYRAMFTLRNMHTKESVLALCDGLKHGSALFKHEVAFVLGQLQDVASVPALKECLCDTSENEMVRHECAEALGAIATGECYQVLYEYLTDEKRVVKESCEIALDMCEYENSPEFQYANTLLLQEA